MSACLPPVALTGVSLASALGDDLNALSHALAAQRSGLHEDHRFQGQSTAALGEINPLRAASEAFHLGESDSPLRRLGLALMRELAESTRLFERYAPSDIGLFLGTTTAGGESWLARLASVWPASRGDAREALLERREQLGSLARHIKHSFPIRGLDLSFATACSASAVALAHAREAVARGLVRCAVAGGIDILTPITIHGFDSLQILDRHACRPFQADRQGMSLAEGGALFLVEARSESRGAPEPLAWLIGAGASSDAYHMTQPEPTGAGMELAMRRALRDAGLEPDAIDYINAHGTGTLANDSAELMAVERLFPRSTPMSSTKVLHGHTLGGAGALEAAVAVAALQRGEAWLPHQVPERVVASRQVRTVLSNSFGFGGNNAALVFASQPGGPS